MKAIILAGGMGTRLRKVITKIPKPMAPVGGKPFLEYLILQLRKWNITEIILSVGFRKEIIKSHFGDGSSSGTMIEYSEEDEPLGTGGALRQAIASCKDSCFVVLNGDSFFNLDMGDLARFHASRRGLMTIGLCRVKSMMRYGSVEIGEDGRVLGFQKKGPDAPGLINGGIYAVHRN
ncbi:MAG: sugar phosphate nucleotidyltransferase, partial [Syntrophales bacterium]|nr:sugar phosphate nucleotidyltransferase [Syntrophales bacterium]